MRIIAIDPGTIESAYVILDVESLRLVSFGKQFNEQVKEILVDAPERYGVERLVIEMIASYGMPVGDDTFETCEWIGRFREASAVPSTKVFRKKARSVDSVVNAICKSPKANDATIIRAIKDMYPQTGGGSTPSVGTKKQPGPLYGVTRDVWQALAVGITWIKSRKPKD